ncbi:hypothetical protein O7635_03215 [Asanoa sp. WMMD1127]|uniref:hypothetical protein n=1 Tax=Asanoa sp. WMMD1127 TaxID=3016107 RepID=UPI002417251A|nr:hypothetical protein [Asanoa sp. WMMD1127]MDG4820862.1 hypothetical protein [Asanoa sp. WMMD1127]
MNTTELRQLLDERSDASADRVMHHLRLQGVATKVRRRRRRRVAAWAACAVVALAGIAAVVVPDRTTTPITPAIRTIEGFPEYAGGARVVAAKSGALPARRVELTITPGAADLVIFSRCDAADDLVLQEKITVNGRDVLNGTCGGAARWSKWTNPSVVVGQPTTFVMTITGAERFDGAQNTAAPVPSTGAFAFAIGERIEFAQFPLPPRPSGTLAPLTGTLPAGCTEQLCPGAVIIRSDPADPTTVVRRTLTWKPLQSIDMVAQTPGYLHVRVDGVQVVTGEWWDYQVAGYGMYGDREGAWRAEFGLDPRPGDEVTIEIVPEHVTGAWQVVLQPVS